MTIKELWQKTKSIVDDAFDKAKQDPIFDDEESKLMLDFAKSKMLSELYDAFDKQEDNKYCKFVLENSELYFDIVRSCISSSLDDGDEKQVLIAVTNFNNKYLEWMEENQENE